ncbi:hypothetical protein [Actinophytocola sp.]|uniref:hypothetical protein n=1 Tax=Actinophytocola sp. TaxID=1872138 RepID=UPI002D7E8C0D|nr:hypothetical protein [Actinophytocola sp.]HET9137873.1 hypothetical protein [Actinophytocola sp.]HEU5107983.1 hypothetical protein [Micromonosporaceae bacterium]
MNVAPRTAPPRRAAPGARAAVAEQAPRGELRRYPGGHFGAYLGEVFDRMATHEVDFLQRHLVPAPIHPAVNTTMPNTPA